MKIFYDENIANNILEAATDMDRADYAENEPKTINQLNSALEKIYNYSSYNDDFLALYSALYAIFGDN